MQDSFRLHSVFNKLKPSSTLYINETVNKLWRQGETVFHMGFGESRFDVHPLLQQALHQHANKKSYLPARGLPALVEAVAKYYTHKLQQTVTPSQVIIGPGSKSLIYGLQMVLRADVFLPSPSWVSYAPQAHLLGGQSYYIPSSVDDQYQLDLAALDELVMASDNPNKVLILNSPNNPTGEVFSRQLLEQIADYCRANNIIVLSDEIYSQICFDDKQHTSISHYYPEGTIVTGGLSKHLSLGGWRVGVALLPDTDFGKELMRKMVIFSSETWSGVAAPIQYAAIKAYALDPEIEQYITDCVAIHGIRTQFIRNALLDIGIKCSGGSGAFYVMANFDDFTDALAKLGVQTSTQLAEHLLMNYRIASLPGIDFGIAENTLSLRLSTSYLDMETEADPERLYSLYKSGVDAGELMSINHHPNTHAAIQAFSQFCNTCMR